MSAPSSWDDGLGPVPPSPSDQWAASYEPIPVPSATVAPSAPAELWVERAAVALTGAAGVTFLLAFALIPIGGWAAAVLAFAIAVVCGLAAFRLARSAR